MTDPSITPPERFCPICARPGLERWRPFCSKRCADVDLNRWLNANYVVAGKETDTAGVDDADAPSPQRRP